MNCTDSQERALAAQGSAECQWQERPRGLWSPGRASDPDAGGLWSGWHRAGSAVRVHVSAVFDGKHIQDSTTVVGDAC